MEQRTKKDSDKMVKKSLAQKERRLKIQIENNKRKLTQWKAFRRDIWRAIWTAI